MSSSDRPEATVTYQLSTRFAGAEGRIFRYKFDPEATTLSPRKSNRVQLVFGPEPGAEPVVVVSDGSIADPVRVGIRLLDADGMLLRPKALLMRGNYPDEQGRIEFPEAVPLSNGYALMLVDDDDAKMSYEFDLLFADEEGNLGWMDPRIENR